MGELSWGLVLVGGYCLLQLPLVLVLARYLDREDGVRPADAAPPSSAPPGRLYPEADDPDRDVDDAPGVDAPDDLVTCGRCGTANDGTYTYCRRCVTRLPAGPWVDERDRGPNGSESRSRSEGDDGSGSERDREG